MDHRPRASLDPRDVIGVVCPLCSGLLVCSGRSYACEKRHSFDLSKEGYLSLLHGKTSYQDIGDDKLMVQARVRVHQLRAYTQLAKAIAGYCPQANTKEGILDIGCGDGFFLNQVAQSASSPSEGVGLDISKGALAKAAKTHPGLFFIRTDAARAPLPFEDSSFGLVLSIFAPRPIEEISRILRADGAWLIVTATQEHLEEVREFLPLAAIGSGKLDAPTSHGYAVLKSTTVSCGEEMAREDLVSTIEMSPSIHRLRREFGDAWAKRLPEVLRVTFSFSMTLLGRDLV